MTATDRDDAPGDQVTYRVSDDSSDSVTVDSNTGIVTAGSRLISDSTASLSFTVQATNDVSV